MNNKLKTLFNTNIILSLIGMINSLYLIYIHYQPGAASFCTISQQLNCDIVNQSIYATIANIPVSVLGFLAYLIFFIGTIVLRNRLNDESYLKKTLLKLLILVIGGFLLSLYLTGIEMFALKTYCILCLLNQLLILGLLITHIYSYSFIKKPII